MGAWSSGTNHAACSCRRYSTGERERERESERDQRLSPTPFPSQQRKAPPPPAAIALYLPDTSEVKGTRRCTDLTRACAIDGGGWRSGWAGG